MNVMIRMLLGFTLSVAVVPGCGGATADDTDGGVMEAKEAGDTPDADSGGAKCAVRSETYDIWEYFPPGTSSGALPACLPTCGVKRKGGEYPHTALPAGPCDAITDQECSMNALRGCFCGAAGPVDEFACACVQGTWECRITVERFPTCDSLCPSFDASTGH